MSGRARAPPPPAAGGLPSLGLLSLKEAPVAAKASVPVYELTLDGEEEEWDSIDNEDVSAQPRLYKGEKGGEPVPEGGIPLWDEQYPDEVAREAPAKGQNPHKVPFIWTNVYNAMRVRVANKAWRLFYGDKGPVEVQDASGTTTLTPWGKELEDGFHTDENPWRGWSEFSPHYNKLAPGTAAGADSSGDASISRSKNAADVWYKDAHYLAGASIAASAASEVVKLDFKLGSAFRGAYPCHGVDSLVDVTCQPFFDWITKHALLGPVAKFALKEEFATDALDDPENVKKGKKKIVESLRDNLKKSLKAKAELARLTASEDRDVDAIKKEKDKITEAEDQLLDAFDDFRDISGSSNPCPMPPGCLRHQHLRPGGYVYAIASNSLTADAYIGVRYEDWGPALRKTYAEGEMKRFYSCKTTSKAWAVFLGISATGSTLDANVRTRNKEGTERRRRAEAVQAANAAAKVEADADKAEKKRKKEEQQAQRAAGKAAREEQNAAAKEARAEEARQRKAKREEELKELQMLREENARLRAEAEAREAQKTQEAGVTDGEVQRFIDEMLANPEGDNYKDYYRRYTQSDGFENIRDVLQDMKDNPADYTES